MEVVHLVGKHEEELPMDIPVKEYPVDFLVEVKHLLGFLEEELPADILVKVKHLVGSLEEELPVNVLVGVEPLVGNNKKELPVNNHVEVEHLVGDLEEELPDNILEAENSPVLYKLGSVQDSRDVPEGSGMHSGCSHLLWGCKADSDRARGFLPM